MRLGGGIYFAENSSKSDEYIMPDAEGNCFIFLGRVLLGTPHVALTSMTGTRLPPFLPNTNSTRRADSVLAECARSPGFENAKLKRYREFVVYDSNVCYPEFLVTFKRVDNVNPAADA